MLVTPATTETARGTLSGEAAVRNVDAPAPQVGTASHLAMAAYLGDTLPLDLSELTQDVVAQLLTEGRLENVAIHYHLPDECVLVEVPQRLFAGVIAQMVAT